MYLKNIIITLLKILDINNLLRPDIRIDLGEFIFPYDQKEHLACRISTPEGKERVFIYDSLQWKEYPTPEELSFPNDTTYTCFPEYSYKNSEKNIKNNIIPLLPRKK